VLETSRRIHLVGIGGTGMSGLAELLRNSGHAVSGCDLRESAVTDRLRTLGIGIQRGHDPAHVTDAELVVFSTAVSSEHAELSAARGRGVPVMSRGTMLAQLVRLYSGIAVAGAHGKTTTTSMIAFALERCGLDPTAAIGGRLSAFGSNARLGRGRHIVVEADESDGSFLELSPDIAVITNLDDEHLERYESFGALREAFVQFGQRVPASGCVVACLDDPHVRGLVPRLGRRTRTYGVDASDADVRAADLALSPNSSSCAVECTGRAGSARALSRRNTAARKYLGKC